MTVDEVAAILFSGIVLGSLYALMSIGLSLVWGSLKIFNFTHGALLALGAYVAWTVTDQAGLGMGLLAGTVVALLVLALCGVGINELLVAPFATRRNADLIILVTTIAGATFVTNAVQLYWGPRLKQLPPVVQGSISILGTGVGWHDIFLILVTLTLLIGLAVFLKRTRLGMAITAVEQNRDFAQLVGISPKTVYRLTFAVSSAFAALAGVLLGSIVFITPVMGDDPLLKAFIVIVFGGLGSMGGTIAGAYAIGIIEAASTFFLGLYVTPVILFLAMIGVMLLRPSGLFGRPE